MPPIPSRGYTRQEASAIALALTLSFQGRLREAGRLAQPKQGDDGALRDHAYVERLAKEFSQRDYARPSSAVRADEEHWIIRHVRAVNNEILRYEDQQLRDLALDLIPFDLLNARATAFESELSLAYQDALVQSLVEWAKDDFLRWIDPVKCSVCGGDTTGISGGIPSREDLSYGASRVELYRCLDEAKSCYGHIVRVPRYNDLAKLLQTRTGRCGEYAAIFMLLLRALNIRARYICNSEDHVWNEYYSENLQRWVHVDSCEGARDKNLLYDQGWGKAMRYCIALGTDGATDVTASYVSDWNKVQAQRAANMSAAMQSTLTRITVERRRSLGADDLERLKTEDQKEIEWLQNGAERKIIAENQALSGRTSGTKEWRNSRKELGTSLSRPQPMQVLQSIASSKTRTATLNGSAVPGVVSGEIILTRDVPDQTGSAFIGMPEELINFVIEFSFSINHNGNDGADGMALVLHGDPSGAHTLGQGGCELGYGGIKKSIAIEIDTYRSQDRCNDPPTPHIAVMTRGDESNSAHHRHSLWCSRPGTLPELDDGNTYHLRLEVFSSKLRIFFTDAKDRDWIELTDEDIGLPEAVCLSSRFIGWTASTGGLHQEQCIKTWELWEGTKSA